MSWEGLNGDAVALLSSTAGSKCEWNWQEWDSHVIMFKITLNFVSTCRLIKDFEREARMDGMPTPTLATRKKQLVQDLNGYISKKKAMSEQAENVATLTGGKKGAAQPKGEDGEHFLLTWRKMSWL